MTRARKGGTPPRPQASTPTGPAGSEQNVQKRIESDRISADIERFEKSGGRIEKLGTTQVLKKLGLPKSDAP